MRTKAFSEQGFSLFVGAIIVLTLVTIGLIGWGISADSSAKKEAAIAPKTAVHQPVSTNSQTSSLSGDDSTMVNANMLAVTTRLEGYEVTNGYYPGDLNIANFPGADPTIFKQPAGVTLKYTVTPDGCTTAQKNCMHYTIVALDKNGQTVAGPKSSMN